MILIQNYSILTLNHLRLKMNLLTSSWGVPLEVPPSPACPRILSVSSRLLPLTLRPFCFKYSLSCLVVKALTDVSRKYLVALSSSCNYDRTDEIHIHSWFCMAHYIFHNKWINCSSYCYSTRKMIVFINFNISDASLSLIHRWVWQWKIRYHPLPFHRVIYVLPPPPPPLLGIWFYIVPPPDSQPPPPPHSSPLLLIIAQSLITILTDIMGYYGYYRMPRELKIDISARRAEFLVTSGNLIGSSRT